ncbi:DUF2917 domain-containing protein [Herbaspirillum sp. RV1423]|uniref:DUF2917 domain-containing protein n=1 Tax=Herbaspirillum sp. RV1423 TaxID=1443993 RepID=UPI0004B7D953|nr:DUF2917 domain-containing protein [Herbaspirillum sp. RV1423]
MTRLTREHHLHLDAGALVSGKLDRSRLLLVRRGHVWITQEGRAEDFWLHAGDALIVQPGRMLVVEAAVASEICLERRDTPGLSLWFGARWTALRATLLHVFPHARQGGR